MIKIPIIIIFEEQILCVKVKIVKYVKKLE